VGEVEAVGADVRGYLTEEVRELMGASRFLDGLFGALRPDAASQDRADLIVLPALRAIAGHNERP